MSKYKYLDKTPVLVLGVHQFDDKDELYDFKNPENWLYIAHQTAGLRCNQHYIVGKILTPTPLAQQLMEKLDEAWLDSNVGALGKRLKDVWTYQKTLQDFGFDCDESYEFFEEAIYPIDITPTTFATICTDELPKDLDDFINFKSDVHQFCGCLNRWGLWILGDNCD